MEGKCTYYLRVFDGTVVDAEILDMIAGKWLVKCYVALSLEMGQRAYRKLRIYKCQTQEVLKCLKKSTCLIA